MRFLMINLILVCLLLFGIGYLAFGDIEIGTGLESVTSPYVHPIKDTPWEASFETLESRERSSLLQEADSHPSLRYTRLSSRAELAPTRSGLNKITKLLEN